MEQLHQQARELRADKMRLFAWVKRLLSPLLWILFRPEVEGADHVPERGGALLVCNHRSFLDSFFQGLVIQRRMHWMAKAELFQRGWAARLLVRLGAFPVQRGASDGEAMETARQLLQAGELVAIFPEGTRVREGLGEPRSGAARLALECSVPLIPMGMVGTERGRLRRAWWHPGERVRIRVGIPVYPPPPEPDSHQQAEAVTHQVWPQIREAVHRLERRRNLALAAGILGTAGAVFLRRRHRRRG